jgi:glycosyltransferase involved in cell wall biosynthesis
MLAVDARWMIGRFRGMGRYAHALLRPVRDRVHALLPAGLKSADYPTLAYGHGFFPYWEQVVLPRLCARHEIGEILCPYNTAPIRLTRRTRLTLVVHDLIYLEAWRRLRPSVSPYQTLGRIYRRTVVPKAVGRANTLVTVSEYTRDQLSTLLGIRQSAIHVIPNSLPDEWYVNEPLPLDQRDTYIFAVAGEAPSKNVSGLIRAFALFLRGLPASAARPELRIAGVSAQHHRHFLDQAARAGIADRVRMLGYLDETALQIMYRQAALFVMPSLYEGFGIPVLEAMASGTPVACSNTTSLPELVGQAGCLFDPRSARSMAEALESAWQSSGNFHAMTQRGLERAQRFRRSVVERQISSFWSNHDGA